MIVSRVGSLFRNLFFKNRLDRDFSEELSSHIDLLTEQKIKEGVPEADARRAALIELGGIEQVKENVRATRAGFAFETFLMDLRYGARALLKQPGFTVTAIVTLALGIGATTAIFSVINGVILRSLPFTDPSRIVMVWEQNLTNGARQNVVSPANFLDWQDQTQSFEHFATFWDSRAALTGNGEPEEIQVQRVTVDFFSVLGVQPVLGRAFIADEDRADNNFAVVLSYELWQRRFGGDPSSIGKTTTIHGRPHRIVGVMPRGFHFFNDRVEAWLPLGLSLTEDYRKSGRFLRTIGRLKPGVTLEQANAELNGIAKQLERRYVEYNTGWGVNVVPLHRQIVGDVRPVLLVLLGAVGFVLVIACANVANLMLSRAVTRQKEFALRAALGAGRNRLIRQSLTESVLLALSGGLVGVFIAYWGVQLLIALGPDNIPRLRDISVDLHVLAFTLIVSFIAGILLGIVPALQSSRPDLNDALRDAGRSSTSRPGRLLRNSFVIAEISLALVLLIGAGLLIRSFVHLQDVKTGFETERLLTMRVQIPMAKYPQPEQRQRFFERVEERIASVPGVVAEGAVNYLPLTRLASSTSYSVVGRPPLPPGQWPGTQVRVVTPGYFKTVGIRLRSGRLLDAHDGDAHVLLINETLARQAFPNENALGRRIAVKWSDDVVDEIVGVVADVKDDAMDADSRPVVYWLYPREKYTFMNLIVRSAIAPLGLARSIEKEIHAVDPDQPVADVRTMQQVVSSSIARPRFNTMLLGIFAGIALVLASVGLYGVINYAAMQRTQEIGIRMALGASRSDIMRLVVGNGMVLTMSGIVIGVIASCALTRVIQNLLFAVGATDLVTYFGVSLFLAAVALLATYIPARKAMRVDPMIALRCE